jgi:eukaryotic-like serine/threonine-protein kinase
MGNGAKNDQLVMEIVSMALRQPASERESYLRAACSDDRTLYREALAVVRSEEEIGSFLQHPPLDGDLGPRPFEPGELIAGRFEILQEIGQGGMGVVYSAIDKKRNQKIAIKAAKGGFHRLLSPELEGALKVRHPNVCLVNEIHTTQTSRGEIDFITMELLHGETLSARLASCGKIAADEAMEITSQLCSGLAEAHRSGVLHRDFKSTNIILCSNPDGLRAVITDFGLSCGVGRSGEAGGTPQYMAPEVLRGEEASMASDIYALGVVLYEMVTGRRPFEFGVQDATAQLTPPSALTPNLNRNWDRVLSQCLAPSPSGRPANPSVVLAELEKRPGRKAPWLILVLAIAIPLASSPVRGWLHNRIWPPKSVRLAIIPVEGPGDSKAAAQGMLQDVSDRVSSLGSVGNSMVVISPQEVAGNLVQTPDAAREVLHATHALYMELSAAGDGVSIQAAVIDLNTREKVANFSGRYTKDTMGTIPTALTEAVTVALKLKGLPSTEKLSSAATAPYDRGLYLLHKDDESFEDAIAQFKQAAQLDLLSPLPLAALAEAEIKRFKTTNQRNALDDAQRYLGAAESLSPASARVRLTSGAVHQAAGHYEAALHEYQRAQDLDPQNIDILLHVASAYNALDLNNDAVATYQRAIAMAPDYYEPYRKFGEYYYYRSEYQKAAEQLTKAIERAPALFDTYNELGAVLNDLGQDDLAEAALLKSIHLHETADAWNSLGAIRAYQKRDKEAVELYQRALALDPQQFVYWLNLGDSNRRLGRFEGANAAYRTALDLTMTALKNDPRDGFTRAFVAYLSARLGHRARAEEEISQAVELSPSDTQVIRRAVLTYEALKERDQAIDAIKRAPASLLRELERQPDLTGLRQDARYEKLRTSNKKGGQ